MAGSVNFSNHQWLVQSLDSNKNGQMDELQFDPRVVSRVDSNNDGSISNGEMTNALKSDTVEVRQGRVYEGRGFPIFVNGLETLKSVRSTASNGISNTHVFTPNFYTDDTSRDRYYKLSESNRKYESAIDQMENSLRSIRDMTEGKTDATSRALNIQAKTTLNSVRWKTWMAKFQQNISLTESLFRDYDYRQTGQDPFAGGGQQTGGGVHGRDPFAGGGNNVGTTDPHGRDPFAGGGNNVGSDDPFGKDPFNGGGSNNNDPVIPSDPYYDRLQPHIREQEMIYNNLQSAYEVMNSALRSIKEQTNDLPDIQASVNATDSSISRAFQNIVALESSSKSGSQVAANIRSTADATEAKATGRTAPFAGFGALGGAIAGGAIGFFAAGKNIKNAAIGAGIGAAAAGGIGALVGSSIDSGYKAEASSLRSLANRVESYDPSSDKATTLKANQSLYNQLFNAREARDLDRARVVNNDVNAIRSQVNPVVDRSSEILSAHRKY